MFVLLSEYICSMTTFHKKKKKFQWTWKKKQNKLVNFVLQPINNYDISSLFYFLLDFGSSNSDWSVLSV